MFTIGGICFIAFLLIEWKWAELPMMPLSMFRKASVSAMMAQSFLVGTIYYTYIYFLPLYFQNVRGDTPLMSAVHQLPLVRMSWVMMLVDAFANRITKFSGPHTINSLVTGGILHIILQSIFGGHLVWLRNVVSWVWSLDFGRRHHSNRLCVSLFGHRGLRDWLYVSANIGSAPGALSKSSEGGGNIQSQFPTPGWRRCWTCCVFGYHGQRVEGIIPEEIGGTCGELVRSAKFGKLLRGRPGSYQGSICCCESSSIHLLHASSGNLLLTYNSCQRSRLNP